MAREIPAGSVEIQTGLWLHEQTKTIGGNQYTFRYLYSAEGYCFWDVSQPANYYYDEETGEQLGLKPENERMYAQWMGLAISYSTWTYEQLNAEFISVPVQDGYEIVSVTNPPVEM